jgi:hypothetical protein
LFSSKGIDIAKTTTTRTPNYRLNTIPKYAGLLRSDVPSVAVPIVKINRYREMLPIWDVNWDHSTIILSINKAYSPLDDFILIERTNPVVKQTQGLFALSLAWDFTNLTARTPFAYSPDNFVYNYTEDTSEELPHQPEERHEYATELPGGHRALDNIEVLSKDLSSKDQAELYFRQEWPACKAFIDRFEEWLQENFFKLTLNCLNKLRPEERLQPPIYQPQVIPERLFEYSSGLPEEPEPHWHDEQISDDLTVTLTCVLCRLSGEWLVAGRLLPSEDGLWVHCNCAIWSNEVREDEHGGILNFFGAMSKAKKSKCKTCARTGATLACAGRKCAASFHFPCALTTGVVFTNSQGIRALYCRDCMQPRDMEHSLSTSQLTGSTHRKLYLTKGKKFLKKPSFQRNAFNRIGPVILCEIPEEGVHELFVSLRRTFLANERVLLRCEKTPEGAYQIKRVSQALDTRGDLISSSDFITDLWPVVHKGESFVLKSAADYFGYNLLSRFLPPLPETNHYHTLKEKNSRSLADVLSHLHPVSVGASVLQPFATHKSQSRKIRPLKSSKARNVYFDESLAASLKNEVALATEYRKYLKNPLRSMQLEVLMSSIHGLGLFANVE